MLRVPGVFRLTVSGSLGGASHSELIHVGFSQDNGSCCLQISDCFCRIGRFKIIKDFGAAGCQQSLRTHIIFDRHRNTGQRTGQGSVFNLSLYFFGAF